MNKLRKKVLSIAAACSVLLTVAAYAAEVGKRSFILNYDVLISMPDDGGAIGKIQQFGVPFSAKREFIGRDFEETEYIFTISSIDGKRGKLMIEFYRFATRTKTGDPVSEFVTEVDFTLGEPAQLQAMLGELSVDLAFNISERQILRNN